MIDKPDALFDRDAEWSDLSSFASDDRLGATLAFVYGRRRQGKLRSAPELPPCCSGH